MRFVVPVNVTIEAPTAIEAASQSKKLDKILKDPSAEILLRSEGIVYKGVVVGQPVARP